MRELSHAPNLHSVRCIHSPRVGGAASDRGVRRSRQSAAVDEPFIGSEAYATVSSPTNTSYARSSGPSIRTCTCPTTSNRRCSQRTTAAWLWTRRRGVVAGLAASAMLGAKWIPDDVPVELIWANPRAPHGITTRRDRLAKGESQSVGGLPVTTPERTAFDLGRLIRGDQAVARLDALGNATRFDASAVIDLARAARRITRFAATAFHARSI